MRIDLATPADAAAVASVLHEVARWLADAGQALWADAEIDAAGVRRDVEAGLFFVARVGKDIVGVMKFELEDARFWPDLEKGSSAFVHKVAVRRTWAGQGVSTALLACARERTRVLGRRHLRLDVVADRAGPRAVYERFGFSLHSTIEKDGVVFARYELVIADDPEGEEHGSSHRQAG